MSRGALGHRHVLAAISIACALGAAALGARADGPAPAPVKAGAPRYDADNVTAISQHMETLVKANARVTAKDFPGAIELYKRAIQLNPRSPLGPYLLAET